MTREEAIKILAREKNYVQQKIQEAVDGDGYVSPDGLIRADDYVEACALAISTLLAQQEAEKNELLKTTWETPEVCPHCMEHLSGDWSFCPECGRPTDWSKNVPLTLEELRKMDGEPVFVVTTAGSIWALVDVQKDKSVMLWSGQNRSLEAEIVFLDGYCYRRKPEERKI